MGACTHPHMKGLVIKRHNETTQHIAQALRLSPLHDTHAYLWMDAGLAAPPGLQDGSHILPTWLLPSLPENERRQYRPDILYIPDWNHHRWTAENISTTTKAETTIYLLEIGYGPDTRYQEKRTEKLQQHTQLVQHLRTEGWTVQEPYILTFGVGGTIYKDFREILSSTFKLTNSIIDNLAHKIQRHTLETAHQLVSTRRFLERTSTEQPKHRTRGSPDVPTTASTSHASVPVTRNTGPPAPTQRGKRGTGQNWRRPPGTRGPSVPRVGGVRKWTTGKRSIGGRE